MCKCMRVSAYLRSHICVKYICSWVHWYVRMYMQLCAYVRTCTYVDMCICIYFLMLFSHNIVTSSSMGPIPTGGPPGKISMCIFICNVHPYTYVRMYTYYVGISVNQ